MNKDKIGKIFSLEKWISFLEKLNRIAELNSKLD